MQKSNKAGRKGIMGRQFTYEPSFMRMVALFYENGDQSLQQVADHFQVSRQQVKTWRLRFSSEIGVPTNNNNVMTEQEQKEFEALKKEKEELAKKLEYANLQVFGLQTMIDIAEEQLKIDIRKKSGSKPSKK
jgi:transposase-like protein